MKAVIHTAKLRFWELKKTKQIQGSACPQGDVVTREPNSSLITFWFEFVFNASYLTHFADTLYF